MQPISIGIDFGTTKSYVGISFQGSVEIIQNEQGSTYTPSCVAFTDSVLLVGATALDQINANVDNTVVGIKRALGREYGHKGLEDSAVEIVNGGGNLPKFDVKFLNSSRQVCPEEAASFIFSKLKDIAETYLKVNGCPTTTVEHVTIAVPLFFTGSQRQAVKDAATIAGVNAHLISEPVAAAIASGIQNKHKGKRNVLVFDIGGGKSEATVLTVARIDHDESYSVVGTASDCTIGGCYFDDILMKYFEKELKLCLREKRDIQRLRKACETVKSQLSILKRATVEAYLDGNEIDIALTRKKFEELCAKVFGKAVDLVKYALNMAQMDCSQIDELVLIGGCTRIPMIRDMFFALFPGKNALETVNPDEIIVRGAAVYHDILRHGDKVVVNEIVSKPIWLCSEDSIVQTSTSGRSQFQVADIRSKIPFETTLTIPIEEKQKHNFLVYQGKAGGQIDEKLNYFFIREPQNGCLSVKVLLRVDEDHRLTLYQEVTGAGSWIPIPRTTTTICGCMSQEDVRKMATEQSVERERVAARTALEVFVYDLQGKFDRLPENAKKCLLEMCTFLDSSSSFQATKDTFERHRRDLNCFVTNDDVSKQTILNDAANFPTNTPTNKAAHTPSDSSSESQQIPIRKNMDLSNVKGKPYDRPSSAAWNSNARHEKSSKIRKQELVHKDVHTMEAPFSGSRQSGSQINRPFLEFYESNEAEPPSAQLGAPKSNVTLHRTQHQSGQFTYTTNLKTTTDGDMQPTGENSKHTRPPISPQQEQEDYFPKQPKETPLVESHRNQERRPNTSAKFRAPQPNVSRLRTEHQNDQYKYDSNHKATTAEDVQASGGNRNNTRARISPKQEKDDYISKQPKETRLTASDRIQERRTNFCEHKDNVKPPGFTSVPKEDREPPTTCFDWFFCCL